MKGTKLPDYDRLEDVDILIKSEPNPDLDKAFSEYLKAHKAKEARSNKVRPVSLRTVKKTKATK